MSRETTTGYKRYTLVLKHNTAERTHQKASFMMHVIIDKL